MRSFSQRLSRLLAIITARRNWPWLALLGLALPLGYAIYSGGGKDSSASAALSSSSDPLSVLAARSPGARTAGALAQSKHRYAVAERRIRSGARLGPRERVLANVRTRPNAPPVAIAPLVALPQGLASAPFSAASLTLPPGNAPGVPIGFVGPGSGGGLNAQPGIIPPTPIITPPVVPSVPEPSTWLMLMTGFFGLGAALRVRRAERVRVPAR